MVNQELDRRVALATERLPQRCKHNHRHSLDQRPTIGGERNEEFNRITNRRRLPVAQGIGLCMIGSNDPETWAGTICEEPIDAKRCPVFDPKDTKASLRSVFEDDLANPEWVQENMAELATLLWALGEFKVVRPSWWRRLVFWVKGVRIEPVLPPSNYDISKLFDP